MSKKYNSRLNFEITNEDYFPPDYEYYENYIFYRNRKLNVPKTKKPINRGPKRRK